MLTQYLLAPPEDTTAVFAALCAATLIALVQAWRRGSLNRISYNHILLPLSVAACSATVLLPATWGLPLLIASGVLMWRSLVAGAESDTGAPQPRSKALGVTCVLLLVALTSALTYRLDSFSSEILTWEGTTIDGLAADLRSGRPLASLALDKTLWGAGPLSSGNESFLFGMPVLALFKHMSASIVSMRAVALFYFMAACAIFTRFVWRAFGGTAALSALAILALSEPSLLYARYGSAVSATLFALIVALALCERLVSTLRLSLAVLAPLALYAATLGYSPGRIPVAVLAFCTPVGILTARSFSVAKRLAATAIFSALLASITLHQTPDERLGLLFSGRGEQIFGMSQTGWFPPQLLSMRTLSNKPTARLLPGEKVGVALELIRQVTANQLALVVSPFSADMRPLDESVRVQTDPPYWRILAPSMTPFALLGFLALLNRRKRWLSAVLALWIVASCSALLLTNRVDTHRAFFLALPLAMYAALGADVLFRSLRQWLPGTVLGATAFAGAFLFAVLPRFAWLYETNPQQPPDVAAFAEVLHRVPGPVTLATSLRHKVSAFVHLAILERQRLSGSSSAWLDERELHDLLRGSKSAQARELEELEASIGKGGTIIAFPPSSFLRTAALLVKHGAETRLVRIQDSDFLLISNKPSPALDQLAPSTTLPEPPSPSPIELPPSRAVPISSIRPNEIVPCSVRPRINLSHDENSLRLNHREFETGIGLHANTTIRFPVPPGTIALNALLGIDDEVLPCDTSSATVRVLDPNRHPLFTSPVLTAGSEPIQMLVNLRGVPEVSIEVNGAGDGTECDHVDLADAAFLLDLGAADPPRETFSCVCPASQ